MSLQIETVIFDAGTIQPTLTFSSDPPSRPVMKIAVPSSTVNDCSQSHLLLNTRCVHVLSSPLAIPRACCVVSPFFRSNRLRAFSLACTPTMTVVASSAIAAIRTVETMALMASMISFKINIISIPFYQHCWYVISFSALLVTVRRYVYIIALLYIFVNRF